MKPCVSVLFLASLVLSLPACGKKSKSAPPPAAACVQQGITMEGDGSVAAPPPCMGACTSDEQCLAINVSCPGCCEFQAISVSYQESYENQRGPECRKYHGLECACGETPPPARCIGNICQLGE